MTSTTRIIGSPFYLFISSFLGSSLRILPIVCVFERQIGHKLTSTKLIKHDIDIPIRYFSFSIPYCWILFFNHKLGHENDQARGYKSVWPKSQLAQTRNVPSCCKWIRGKLHDNTDQGSPMKESIQLTSWCLDVFEYRSEMIVDSLDQIAKNSYQSSSRKEKKLL